MLINNVSELKEHLPVSLQLAFEDIQPKVRMVEREVIKKKFGTPIYDHLMGSPLTGPDAELHTLLAEAVAHLALLHYIDFGQVQIDSSGIHIFSTQDSKNAFQWQISNLEENCSKQGWSAIESALELLDSLPAGDLRTLWESTTTFQMAQKSLISSLRQFQKHVHLGDSRVLFHKLLPTMEYIQEEVVKEAIGSALWDILTGYASEQDADQKIRLAKAHKLAARALAFGTVGEGFMDAMLILSDNGPLILDGLQSRITTSKATAPKELVEAIAETYAQKGQGAITELLEYCQLNAAHFPEYAFSPNYITEEGQENHIPRNDPDSGLVFL